MPYVAEKYKIPKEFDKRIKLNKEDKEEIRKLYETGLYSQRYLAKQYNVSRSLIRIVISPERERRVIERRKQCNYYDKDKHREYIKKYRHHKQDLYLKGILEKDIDK